MIGWQMRTYKRARFLGFASVIQAARIGVLRYQERHISLHSVWRIFYVTPIEQQSAFYPSSLTRFRPLPFFDTREAFTQTRMCFLETTWGQQSNVVLCKPDGAHLELENIDPAPDCKLRFHMPSVILNDYRLSRRPGRTPPLSRVNWDQPRNSGQGQEAEKEDVKITFSLATSYLWSQWFPRENCERSLLFQTDFCVTEGTTLCHVITDFKPARRYETKS